VGAGAGDAKEVDGNAEEESEVAGNEVSRAAVLMLLMSMPDSCRLICLLLACISCAVVYRDMALSISSSRKMGIERYRTCSHSSMLSGATWKTEARNGT